MSSNTLDAATLEQGAKRRSFPGNQNVAKGPEHSVAMTASTSQVSPAPTFKGKQISWYSKVVKREAPLIGLLSTGTAMVVLNQVIADQVHTILDILQHQDGASNLTNSLPQTGYS